MKKILTTLAFIFGAAHLVTAQNVTTTVGSGSLMPTENYCAKLRADILIENHFSVGLQTNFYKDKYTSTGFVLEPNLRVYFNKSNSRNAFYWQLSGFAGQVEHVQLYAHEVENDQLETTLFPFIDMFSQLLLETIENKEYILHPRTYEISISGIGSVFGWKKIIGKKELLFIDMNLGIKGIKPPAYIAETIFIEGQAFTRADKSIFSNEIPGDYRLVEDSRALKMVTGFVGVGYKF